MSKCRKGWLIFLLFFTAAGPGCAEILFDRCENILRARNFWYDELDRSDTRMLAFNEKQGVPFETGVLMVQPLNRWDEVENLIEVRLRGASVDSHMIFFQKDKSPDRLKVVAEVEFDGPVIGFLADGLLFGRTNPYFAPDPTHKKPPEKKNVWSLEEEARWTPLDRVTILSPNRIRMEFTNHSATDPLRVLTLKKGSVSFPGSSQPLVITAAGETKQGDPGQTGIVAAYSRDGAFIACFGKKGVLLDAASCEPAGAEWDWNSLWTKGEQEGTAQPVRPIAEDGFRSAGQVKMEYLLDLAACWLLVD
jgi:hypothetical protein